jgi:hypothetical protein
LIIKKKGPFVFRSIKKVKKGKKEKEKEKTKKREKRDIKINTERKRYKNGFIQVMWLSLCIDLVFFFFTFFFWR